MKEIRATLKPYTIHVFNPSLVGRTEKDLDKVMSYSNQPVIIKKIHQYWDKTLYTVIPLQTPTESEFIARADELWFARPMKLGKKNNYPLFSNDIDQFDERELVEVHKEIFEDDPNEDDLYHIAENLINTYFSDLLSEIEEYENVHGQSEYIVLANIGLWYGRCDGGKIITGMKNVIYECIEDLDYYEIFFKNGQLHISGSHHDGTNTFVIRELKDESADYIKRHEYDTEPRDLHRHLFNSNRWSMRVKMFDILGYGGGIY